jgi:hypothetical protein
MPNGNPSITPSDWVSIRAFFQKLSATLLSFADDHNLKIDQYYHESPSWSFRFRHPKGGAASVNLERIDDLTVRVHGDWYIDEYEIFTRHMKSSSTPNAPLENIDLRNELETSLKEVASWERQDMTPYSRYKKIWSRYTKKEWDKMSVEKHLPTLRL